MSLKLLLIVSCVRACVCVPVCVCMSHYHPKKIEGSGRIGSVDWYTHISQHMFLIPTGTADSTFKELTIYRGSLWVNRKVSATHTFSEAWLECCGDTEAGWCDWLSHRWAWARELASPQDPHSTLGGWQRGTTFLNWLLSSFPHFLHRCLLIPSDSRHSPHLWGRSAALQITVHGETGHK